MCFFGTKWLQNCAGQKPLSTDKCSTTELNPTTSDILIYSTYEKIKLCIYICTYICCMYICVLHVHAPVSIILRRKLPLFQYRMFPRNSCVTDLFLRVGAPLESDGTLLRQCMVLGLQVICSTMITFSSFYFASQSQDKWFHSTHPSIIMNCLMTGF